MKQIITTAQAPAPIGPYSQAILHSGTLYVSGQIAINPETGDLETDSIEVETQRVLSNMKAVLNAAGMDFDHVVKCSIFLADMNDFQTVNEEYAKAFTSSVPARECVQVSKLPKGVSVEISCIAVK